MPLLTYLWKKARAACDDDIRQNRIPSNQGVGNITSVELSFSIPGDSYGYPRGAAYTSTDGVNFTGTNSAGAEMRNRQALAMQAQQAAQQAQMLAKLTADRTASFRAKFTSDYGIQQWFVPIDGQPGTELRPLIGNPYIFKDRIIALYLGFDHVLSENDAVFQNWHRPFVVSGVPSTMFQGPTDVVLAAKVLGVKQIGAEAVPHLQFIGAFSCGGSCPH